MKYKNVILLFEICNILIKNKMQFLKSEDNIIKKCETFLKIKEKIED